MAFQELLLVNPSAKPSKRRKAKRAKSTKKPSAAQLAARKRFIEMVRERKANPVKKRKASARRSNPRRKLTLKSNPVRRSHKRRATARRVTSRRRRNPINIGAALNRPMAMIKPALIGATGAVLVNQAIKYLPLPASLMTGKVRYLTQAGVALGLGMLASKLGTRAAVAQKAVEGSLTVTMYQAMVSIASDAGMNLGWYSPAQISAPRKLTPQTIGAYVGRPQLAASRGQTVGAYVSGSPAAIGRNRGRSWR